MANELTAANLAKAVAPDQPLLRKRTTLETYVSKVDDTGLEDISSNRVVLDPFEPYYIIANLIQPPFRFPSLYKIAEASDMLTICTYAYQKNIDGFGYRLDFLGDDRKELNTDDAKEQLENAEQFFENPNPYESFHMIRDHFRKDYEFLGQGAFEVVRFRSGGISALYHSPMIALRMGPLEAEPITLTTSLFRNGRMRKVNVRKRFRKFAQIRFESDALKWFKEFGDPRILDATTGEYVNSRKDAKEVATEILLIQQPSGGRTYAIPRWVPCVTDVMGRENAQYINYDIGESQGIPPFFVLVQNGTLSDESKDELRRLAESMRGPENFNRIGLFEALPDMQGLDDKGTVKIELKNMMDYRASDFMFSDYLKNTAAIIRQAFRLPEIYLGSIDSSSYASSYTAIKMCESQVFVPEREMFDEQINKRLMWGQGGLGCPLWKYVTQGPQIVATEELRLSLKELVNSGAITINNSIDITNKLFGTTVSKYKETWADLPIVLVKLMANKGTFVLPQLSNADPQVGADGKNIPKGGGKNLPKDPGKPVTTGGSGKTPPINTPNQRGNS